MNIKEAKAYVKQCEFIRKCNLTLLITFGNGWEDIWARRALKIMRKRAQRGLNLGIYHIKAPYIRIKYNADINEAFLKALENTIAEVAKAELKKLGRYKEE